MATGTIKNVIPVQGNGYLKFPDGTMIQRGYASKSVSANSTETISVSFAQPFTGNPVVVTSYVAHVPEIFNISTESQSTTGFDIRAKNNYSGALNAGVYWIAMGNWA